MKSKLILICTLLAAVAARAQVFDYNNGDLILDFSASGASDVEIDIGSASSLTSLAQAAGGTVVLGTTNYNFSTLVVNNFGSSLDGVSFSVVGTLLGSGPATDWLSQTQAGANPNTPPNNLNSTKQSQVSGVVDKIEGVGSGTGIIPWSTANAANPLDNTSNLVVIPTSGTDQSDSYTKSVGSTFLGAPANPKNTAPANFSSGSIVSDLFEFDPTGGVGSSIYLGSLTLNSNGTLAFSLPVAPTPPKAVITALSLSGGTVTVTFNTTANVQYSLLYTTQLNTNPIVWTSIPGSVTGTGAPATLTDSNPTDAARYYTVQSSYP